MDFKNEPSLVNFWSTSLVSVSANNLKLGNSCGPILLARLIPASVNSIGDLPSIYKNLCLCGGTATFHGCLTSDANCGAGVLIS